MSYQALKRLGIVAMPLLIALSQSLGSSCRPCGTHANSFTYPALPCRAFRFRRFAAGIIFVPFSPGLRLEFRSFAASRLGSFFPVFSGLTPGASFCRRFAAGAFLLHFLRAYAWSSVLSPLRGWAHFCFVFSGLTPGASFFRRFAAGVTDAMILLLAQGRSRRNSRCDFWFVACRYRI